MYETLKTIYELVMVFGLGCVFYVSFDVLHNMAKYFESLTERTDSETETLERELAEVTDDEFEEDVTYYLADDLTRSSRILKKLMVECDLRYGAVDASPLIPTSESGSGQASSSSQES